APGVAVAGAADLRLLRRRVAQPLARPRHLVQLHRGDAGTDRPGSAPGRALAAPSRRALSTGAGGDLRTSLRDLAGADGATGRLRARALGRRALRRSVADGRGPGD